MSTVVAVVSQPGEVPARVRIAGDITEESSFAALADLAAPIVVLDLAEVRRINSAGVREWVNFIKELGARREVRLERCAVAVVQQLNVVRGFCGNATVTSLFVPYLCAACGREHVELFERSATGACEPPETLPCPECGGTMDFDDLPEAYLAFLSREGSA